MTLRERRAHFTANVRPNMPDAIFHLLLLAAAAGIALICRARGKLKVTRRERICAAAFGVAVIFLGLVIQVAIADRPFLDAVVSDGTGFDATAYAGFRLQMLGYIVLIYVVFASSSDPLAVSDSREV
jgi:hypothetical protein